MKQGNNSALHIILWIFLVVNTSTIFSIKTGPVERVFGNYGKIQTLAISKDGRQLAFSSDYRDGKGDIILYEITSKKKKFLTRTDGLESQPVFSPDGKYIYYFSNENKNGSIYRISTSGGPPERLSPENFWCEFPTISPDGRFLAYYSRRDGTYNLYQLDLQTNTEKQLTSGTSLDFGPTYSQSGRDIFFYSNRNEIFSIYKLNVASEKVTPLTGPGGFTFQPSTDYLGQYVFCVSNKYGNNDIFAVSLHGNEAAIPITTETAHDIFPTLDVTNKVLYFISQREGDFGIYKMNLK